MKNPTLYYGKFGFWPFGHDIFDILYMIMVKNLFDPRHLDVDQMLEKYLLAFSHTPAEKFDLSCPRKLKN